MSKDSKNFCYAVLLLLGALVCIYFLPGRQTQRMTFSEQKAALLKGSAELHQQILALKSPADLNKVELSLETLRGYAAATPDPLKSTASVLP